MPKNSLDPSDCGCIRTSHEPIRIVLTGGPGAGKTAILEVARKQFCDHVTVLPEAAGIIFTGGFWRRTSPAVIRAAQRAIFHVQRELERVVDEEKEMAAALCDRGTLDGLAYWPESEPAFWKDLGTTRSTEMARYSVVIHLRTPPAHQGYNKSNPLRVESPQQAQEIDRRILQAWDGHPKRVIIESTAHFFDKARIAIEAIKSNLPDCCRGNHKA